MKLLARICEWSVHASTLIFVSFGTVALPLLVLVLLSRGIHDLLHALGFVRSASNGYETSAIPFAGIVISLLLLIARHAGALDKLQPKEK